MSRVGNAPIKLPDGVDVSANGAVLTAKGSKGELSMTLPSAIDVSIQDKIVTVKPGKKDVAGKSIWGTVRANINNMVTGVQRASPVTWKSMALVIVPLCRGTNCSLTWVQPSC